MRLKKSGRLINKIPGPYSSPFMGNLVDMQIDNEQLFYLFRKWNAEYYPMYRLWSCMVPAVNIMHPDDVEVILSSQKFISKSYIYEFLHPWLSSGLLTSDGAKWQKRRKILTPAFHFNILTHFVDIINEESQNLIKLIKERGNDESIVEDVQVLASEHTLNLICETAMGISIKGKKNTVQNSYRAAVKGIGNIITNRIVKPWLYHNTIFNFLPLGRVQNQLLQTLHGFTNNIIAERKRYHENTGRKYLKNFEDIEENVGNSTMTSGSDNDDNDNLTTRKRRLAMLDLLIEASWKNNEIDDEGIREEVDTFTFEGHDTTSMALCSILLLLAKHKDIQERARNEVKPIMSQEDCKLTISMVQGFTYLERCIKEALRLYPSVPFISREIKQECKIRNYTIPSGTMCHIHIYETHRDPEHWPNPLIYDPDRFLPENIKGRHSYAYVPFSAGPRNCIGQKFALLEMKIMVAYILHNFVLEPVDEIDEVRYISDLVLRPKSQVRVKFTPIHH